MAVRQSVILSPSQYSDVPVYDLLEAASQGLVGVDRRWLRAIVDRGERGIPDLVRFASRNYEDDLVILEEELIAIFRLLRTPQGIPFLLDIVREEADAVPDDVVGALVDIGEPAVEPLIDLYRELDAEDNDVPFLLASLGVRDPRILSILVDRLAYDPVDAAICLNLYGDPAAKPDLEKTIADLAESEVELRAELERTLRLFDEPRPERTPDPHEDIYTPYPERALPMFELMDDETRLAFLESPEEEYRKAIVADLARGSFTSQVQTRLLRVTESDSSAAVRAAAWEGLGQAISTDKKIREKLVSVVQNETAPLEERCGALTGLAAEPDAEVHAFITHFYELSEARASALEAMWRTYDPRYAPYFSRHIDEENPEIRREAIWGVGHLRLVTEAAKLRKLFHDSDLREDALFSYALAWPGEISRSRARSFLRKIETEAGGLAPGEGQIVEAAIDQRLVMSGLRTVFSASEEEQEALLEEELTASKVGRNDACPCGSGKKYKKCCGQ